MKKKTLKYFLKLYVDEKRIPTKPYILNTLGNVCKGFFDELTSTAPDSSLVLKITPQNPKEKQVSIECEGNDVEIKGFVQELILKTLIGFISTLNDLPESFPTSLIKIEYQTKN